MEQYCPECNCHKFLHDDLGCMCEDTKGHPDTLEITDGEEYCKCMLTPAELGIKED